jgi:hypothetical protein
MMPGGIATMQMVKRGSAVLLLISAWACAGSGMPTAQTPVPPAGVAGLWSGTLQATQVPGNLCPCPQIAFPYTIAFVMNLTQAGSAVSGTWATSQAMGTVAGVTSPTSFSGTLTWNSTTTGACTGTLAVGGPAGGKALNWTSPGVTGTCTTFAKAITLAFEQS